MGLCCLPLSRRQNQMVCFLLRYSNQWMGNFFTSFTSCDLCSSSATNICSSNAKWLHTSLYSIQHGKRWAMAPPDPHSPSASVSVVIMPACPPVDCFLRVLQQHQTGYKSHCIITAPCFASLSARPLHATDWPARLLARPLRTGHRCNRKSRLLPWGRWLGERGSPWTVNHALSCAPRIQCCCLRRAECGATRRAAYQQRHTEQAHFLVRTRRLAWWQKIHSCQVIGLFEFCISFPCISQNSVSVLQGVKKLIVWDICSCCCDTFLVECACTGEKINRPPCRSLQRESSKGKVKTDVFVHSHVEALDYCCWHSSTGSFFINTSPAAASKGRNTETFGCKNKREKKINQNSIMGCPLLRNAFAGLFLVLLSKGKFLRAT